MSQLPENSTPVPPNDSAASPRALPEARWSRAIATAFLLLLVPYYAMTVGWRNFLWLSDLSLFTTVVALWLESPLLISMLGLGVLPFELYWNLTFFTRLITGAVIGEIPDYMFDERLPLLLRIISLFHVALPFIWIDLLSRWGYDPRALRWQSAALLPVVLLTYALTPAELNINWVYAPAKLHLGWLPEPVYLVAYVVALPVLLYWPLHRLYAVVFAGAPRDERRGSPGALNAGRRRSSP